MANKLSCNGVDPHEGNPDNSIEVNCPTMFYPYQLSQEGNATKVQVTIQGKTVIHGYTGALMPQLYSMEEYVQDVKDSWAGYDVNRDIDISPDTQQSPSHLDNKCECGSGNDEMSGAHSHWCKRYLSK